MRTLDEVFKAMQGDDERPEVQILLRNLKSDMPRLESLLQDTKREYEDGVYRFYTGSYKVVHLQSATREIVSALQAAAPQRQLDTSFMEIVKKAAHTEESALNIEEDSRLILEGFLHARYFLQMAVQFGKKLDTPPCTLPSGWAALLCLYGLR